MGIIGILMALLLEQISLAKAKALRIQCINSVHQLGTGLQTFVADNHGYPVFWRGTPRKPPPPPDELWAGELEKQGFGVTQPDPHFYRQGVWFCPSAQWSDSMQRALSAAQANGGAYYGYNDDMLNGHLEQKDPTNQFGLQGHYAPKTRSFQPIMESEVICPAEMMAIGDSFDASIIFMRRNPGSMARFGNIMTRHSGKVNVVFCDGHAESPTIDSVFTDTSDAALARWNRDHLPHRELLAN